MQRLQSDSNVKPALKTRFNRDFWIENRHFFALALDGKKRKVDSLTSNIGHLLWSGIVEDDKVAQIVGHLMGPKLFSGWVCAQWHKERQVTTPSAITTVRCGHTTIQSLRPGCGALDIAKKQAIL
jgi:hypothetical protein